MHAGRNAITCPVEGISKKLQWIQDLAIVRKQNKIVCIHDDIWIKKRISLKDYHLRKATDDQIVEMFEEIDRKLDTYTSVGIRTRAMNHDSDPVGEEAARQVILHGTLPFRLKELGIRYDAVNLMEDFHVTLSLLERGIPNYIIHTWCYQESPPGTAGGCALYRTAENQREAALKIQELHPKFVKAVNRPARWGIGASMDVQIAWKKAYESGLMSKRKKLV